MSRRKVTAAIVLVVGLLFVFMLLGSRSAAGAISNFIKIGIFGGIVLALLVWGGIVKSDDVKKQISLTAEDIKASPDIIKVWGDTTYKKTMDGLDAINSRAKEKTEVPNDSAIDAEPTVANGATEIPKMVVVDTGEDESNDSVPSASFTVIDGGKKNDGAEGDEDNTAGVTAQVTDFPDDFDFEKLEMKMPPAITIEESGDSSDD